MSTLKIVLTDSEPWNPHIVSFPGISELEATELEGRNVSSVVYDLMGKNRTLGMGTRITNLCEFSTFRRLLGE